MRAQTHFETDWRECSITDRRADGSTRNSWYCGASDNKIIEEKAAAGVDQRRFNQDDG